MTQPTLLTQPGYPFSFDPSACDTCKGRCCNGESGNIWITRGEIEILAETLGVDVPTLADNYLKKVGYRTSIAERYEAGNYACLLYDDQKGGCSVYEARPAQCRSFPFWDYFKERPDEAAKECPGVILRGAPEPRG
ncbi:YkgJ family cysteine cluster protein [Desulfoluna sp.]|uniref:YkgJ family cysteine cluster protein n=1 Tax=Desulfoluna sp. TaxID=2045199 RepID=UPI00261D1696|nr:YkgJ family cysteine cluster protein [Desulfoluna sp.]